MIFRLFRTSCEHSDGSKNWPPGGLTILEDKAPMRLQVCQVNYRRRPFSIFSD